MSKTKEQLAREELVKAVAACEDEVVDLDAVCDDSKFESFLNKVMDDEYLSFLDHIDIIMDLEEALDIEVPNAKFTVWRDLYNVIIEKLSEA